MTTWVWISVAAAFLQNLRSAVQKRLTGRLSTRGATATRFLYGLPFAALYLGALLVAGEATLPAPNARFALFVLGGSLAQIGATALLLATFTRRSFAVGTALSKTEGIQAVLIGFVFLHDTVSAAGFAGVALTVLGVLALGTARTSGGVSGGVRERWEVAGIGLLSGALFATASVCYRGASLALGDGGFVVRAACTLVVALCIQCVAVTLWLRVAEPGELGRVGRAWRDGLVAGATGAGASAGWFTAVTLVNAAYVKAVGSVELLFAATTSWLVFGERPTRAESFGVALVALGVVVTVLSR